jgi:DHA1 family bicyclomycin/chloramphenicol resistance-like MFS transporter
LSDGPPHLPTAPKPLLVANLVAQIGFGLLAMTICLPSMQEWGTLFGADQARVQLSFSGYLVAYGSLQLVYGPMSDRFGRKPILMFGLLLAALGSILAALASDLDGLTAARVLQGAGTAAGMVAGRAMVQDLFPGSQRTRVMAYVGMAMGLCPPVATLVGGQIHVRLGWQANFIAMAALAALLLVWAWIGLPARAERPAPRTHWLGDMFAAYGRLAGEPAFLMNVTILSMTVGTFYAFLSGAPVVLRSYGVGPADIGWYIMAVPLSFIVGNFLTSRLSHRFGDRRMMQLGQTSTVAGIGLMLALGVAGMKTPLAFCLPLMLLGIGHGLLMPACLAGAVGLIPSLAGAAAAVAGVAQQLMGALGGYAVGLVPHDGSVNLGLLMMGLTLAAILAQTILHRQISATPRTP